MHKVLLTSNKDERLDTFRSPIVDPEYDICYEDATCKKFVE